MAFFGGETGTADDGIFDLLEKQRTLNNAVSTLKVKATPGGLINDELLASITDIETCLPVINKHIAQDVLPERFTEYCPPHSAGLAQKVFDISEILEMILAKLNIDTLLGAQFINRQFRDAVESSTKLQRQLSLLPHKHFSVPLNDLDELPSTYINEVDTRSSEPSKELEWNETVVVARFNHKLPRVGARCRRMLVIQPPAPEMKAFVGCCSKFGDNMLTKAMVRNKDGVTVGDLLEMAARLQKHHLHCVHAPVRMYNAVTGCVDVQVSFEAVVRLSEQDLRLAVDPAASEKFRVSMAKRREERKVMKAFVAQKRITLQQGLELPKLPAFRERYVTDEGLNGSDTSDSSDEE